MKNLFKTLITITAALTLVACGKKSSQDMGSISTAIGVNGYLWQATLDTLDFMSISESNPQGGVIVTEWHADKNSPDERVKVTVRFMGQILRSDGIKVIVVRQKQSGGNWINQDVNADTGLKIQDAILLAARNLKQGIREQR